MDEVEVRNAADAEQVLRAEQRIERRRHRYDNALKRVLATAEGRFVFGDRELGILARAGVNRTVYAPDRNLQSMNIGRQNFGLELLAELIRVDEAMYELMDREARQLARQDGSSRAASHTARAERE